MFESEKMKILILGGAGFIGSNLAEKFVNNDYDVTIIDGLLKKTGGRLQNVSNFLNKITFIEKRIEEVHDLSEIISKQDIIIDSMSWTSHLSALKDPFYDLELNVKSHLYFLEEVKKNKIKPGKIIYLGSRGQYGNPNVDVINETTPMIPEDIQGVHKLAAENYYRVYSKLCKLNVVSLRITGCFGQNQPYQREDIGLMGNLIRDAINGKIIEIYGEGRKRNMLYVYDLADVILKVSKKDFSGFNAFNISGCSKLIKDLAEKIVSIVGKGSVLVRKIPAEIEAIDIGNAEISDIKIRDFIKEIKTTKMEISLLNTINYFIQRIKNK